MRVHDWLKSHGYDVAAEGIADSEIAQEIERRRSLQHTWEAASALKAGTRDFDRSSLEQTLSEFGWQASRILRPHQIDGVAHVLTAINTSNFSVPGSGKTVTALATAVTHIQSGTIDLIVVVGPLACFDPWEQEARAAMGDRIRIRRIRGNAASRHSPGTVVELCDRGGRSISPLAAFQGMEDHVGGRRVSPHQTLSWRCLGTGADGAGSVCTGSSAPVRYADAKVTIHILLATFDGEPTIDHLVDTSLLAKDARIHLLLEGANLGPISLSDNPPSDAEGNERDLEVFLRYLLGEGS